jgi:aspartate/methionine/tyrosine aminotransferase
MLKSQDTILICPTVVSQVAACAAMEVGRAHCEPHVRALSEIRETVLAKLSALTSIAEVPPADGAFYCLLKIDTDMPPLELAERLIREHQVAVTPGTAFGMHDGCYFRVAYGALQRETVSEGIGRLVSGLRRILAP